MEQQYEVISYSNMNFKFTAGTLYYCVPHMHKEFELGLILKGEQHTISHGLHYTVPAGDMWLMNSCQTHELSGARFDEPYTFIELQLRPSFFNGYFRELGRTEFMHARLCEQTMGKVNYRQLYELMVKCTYCYMRQEKFYELKCAAMINSLFELLLTNVPNHVLDEQETQQISARSARVQRITKYVEERFDQKLLLSELADIEGLTLSYLSHLFTDNFGMSFQKYLLHLRCQRAQEMLIGTDMTLTDIAISCGFSASRYFDKGFREIYGIAPRDYRTQFKGELQGQKLLDKQHMTRVARGTTFYTAEDTLEIMDKLLGSTV